MQNLNAQAKEMSDSNLFCEQQGFHLSTCYP